MLVDLTTLLKQKTQRNNSIKEDKPDPPRTLTSGERRDVSTTNLIDTNLLKISTKIKDGLLSEIDLSGLDGLKSGYQFISDPDDMGWVTAQGPKTAKGEAGEAGDSIDRAIFAVDRLSEAIEILLGDE